MACEKKCIILKDNTNYLEIQQKNGGCFNISEKEYHLCIKNTHLDFKAELGYVSVNNRYAPLPDKPQINHKVLEAGNNTYEYLGIEPTIIDITEQDIDEIIFGG